MNEATRAVGAAPRAYLGLVSDEELETRVSAGRRAGAILLATLFLLSAPLTRLVERMLARDPAERPAAADVATELEPLVAELPRRIPFGRRRA